MNPELLFNQYIMPIYISATNMVCPLVEIKFDFFYNYLVQFATFVWQNINIIGYTISFIMKEAYMTINNNLSFTEKFLIIICLYNFIAFLASEIDSLNVYQNLQEKLASAEEELKILKTREKMRENWEHIWTSEIKTLYNTQSEKFNNIEQALKHYKECLDRTSKNFNKFKREFEQFN